MPFNLNFIFVLLKFVLNFIVYIFLLEILWIKYIALLLSFVVIFLLKTYPRKRFKRLSQLRAYKKKNTFLIKYRLVTIWDHVWNIIVLSSFFIIFILGFFLLRYFNMEKDVDLIQIYNLLQIIFIKLSWHVNLVNIILLINIFLIYVLSFKQVLNFYKFHLMKRHFYLMDDSFPYNIYTNIIYNILWTHHAKIFRIIDDISEGIVKFFFHKSLENNLQRSKNLYYYQRKFTLHTTNLFFTVHYYILLFIFIYDLYFHNYHLIYFYKILPFIFLYDLYVKACRFSDKLNNLLDTILKKMIYHYEEVKYIDDEYFYFGESDFDTVSIEQLRIAVNVYMYYDFDKEAVYRYEKKHQNN